MARITTTLRHGRRRTIVSGVLSFRDLGRLERACGVALEAPNPSLEICLKGVSSVDEASQIFLHQLARRGVLITKA